ncbi:MAG: hypothetical protein ACLQAN_00185 [Acidimicrobiales bacterium]
MRNLSHQHPWRQAGVISLSVFLGCSLLSVAAGASSGLADSPLASAASQLDGTWTATFTVYSSTIPIAQPGQQLTGLTFTVEGSQISGDISGTIDLKTQTLPTLSGQLYVAQVTSSAIGQGVSCQGEIYFTSQGFSYVGAEYEDSIKCNGGQITGSIDGYRVSGSSTGTSSTTTTTPTPTCGVPTAPFPATGVFVTVTVTNHTGEPVIVYDTAPVGGADRRSSLSNGQSFGYDEETGDYLFVTSQSSGKCVGHWQIEAGGSITLPNKGSPTLSTTTPDSATTTTIAETPCLETATCVIPLLRAPTVSHGVATLVDAKTGVSESLADVRSLVPYDSVHTKSGVARLAVEAGAVTAGASLALVIGAGSVWALPALPIVVLSGTVFQFTSLQTLGDVLYDVTGRSLQPEVRTSEMITRVNYAACGKCVSAGPIPHAETNPNASFSVEITQTYSRVRVYAGAVTVQNLRGAMKTVTVQAGFQSIVRLVGPPTTPGRFAMPKIPFWQ